MDVNLSGRIKRPTSQPLESTDRQVNVACDDDHAPTDGQDQNVRVPAGQVDQVLRAQGGARGENLEQDDDRDQCDQHACLTATATRGRTAKNLLGILQEAQTKGLELISVSQTLEKKTAHRLQVAMLKQELEATAHQGSWEQFCHAR